MEPDPYAPPTSAPAPLLAKVALKEIVLAWERLRLLYNALLLVPGILVLAMASTHDGLPLVVGVGGAVGVAVGANVAFFLGPLAELYLRGLFRNGEPIGRGRWLIFGAGLVVSAGVFAMAVGLPV